MNKAILSLIFSVLGLLLASYAVSEVYASSETVNLQGKIVRNDAGNEGLNVSAGSPACVFLGPSNDTCDFRVKYYSADAAGTLLATEVFNNVEIGEYNGIFNLVLGAGSFSAGSESSFRNIFLNNASVFVEMDFAPDGTNYTETFLNENGKRMGVRAAGYAISSGGANKQFQFDVANDDSGYADVNEGQVYFDGNDSVLRVFDGTQWLAIQAAAGNVASYWVLNNAANPEIVYSATGLDVAIGGSTSSSPFFYDVSEENLTLTNTKSGYSFKVNDEAGDTTPFVIDAAGKIGIGTASPTAALDIAGRTVKYSNLESEYNWKWEPAMDLNWKTIANINIGPGLWGGGGIEVDVMDYETNIGQIDATRELKYFVTMLRSTDVANNMDMGSVNGPMNEYVRLVKTSIGVYELQVRSPRAWTSLHFRAQVVSGCLGCGPTTVTYVDSPATGSNSGVIYTADPDNMSFFSNAYVSGNLGVGTTDTAGAKFRVKGTSDQVQEAIMGFSSQTYNLTEWQNSSGVTLAGVTADGTIFSNQTIKAPEMLVGLDASSGHFGVKANTTNKAQINLVSSEGVDVANPLSGDLWWNGTNLYFFDGSSTIDLLVGTGGPGGGLFTDGGDTTYLTSITDNLALGGVDSSAPFFFDAGNELLTLTNTTSGLSFRVNDEASDTTPFVIDADGNVGIGTDSPSARLDIAGAASIITNTSGDITFDSASGLFSFAGDSISNLLNANLSGNLVLNGGQLQLTNYADNPTALGDGSLAYNNVAQKLIYANGGNWKEVVGVAGGSLGQTIRHNGTDWEASDVLINTGTDLEVNGQLRVGNYTNKPTGTGAGSLVYDTTLGSLFVYDGTDWQAISTSQFKTTSGVVSSGSYLNLAHNLGTTDIIANAWVKIGSQWKPAVERWNDITHDLEQEFNQSLMQSRTEVAGDLVRMKESADFGTGRDGDITVSGNYDVNVSPLASGRSSTCVDSTQYADQVNYSVTALTANTATVTPTPSANCLVPGDEVLLINLQGTHTSSVNIGNYESLRVASIAGNVVTFTTGKSRFYGEGASDTAIGTANGTHRVMIQRVPNYRNVTVNNGGQLYPAAYNGVRNGVLFFRATGTVTVASGGYISAYGRGWQGGVNDGSGAGTGGASYCGGYAATLPSGGARGGYYNYFDADNAGSRRCGGGGGGRGYGYDGSTWQYGQGSTGLNGGAGGGGGGAYAASTAYIAMGGGGGGGGHATAGAGGNAYSPGIAGGAGGTLTSGNGGAGGYNYDGHGYGGGGGGGGTTPDPADLSQLWFGSGGGAGGYGEATGNVQYGGAPGGAGGGIIYISANTVTVTGSIQSHGANGSQGSPGSNYGSGSGGGGAGGSVKIVGSVLSLGSSLVTASGGAGGPQGGAGNSGGAGGAGRIAVYSVNSVTGSTSPAASTFTQPYYPYGVYNSKVESIVNSSTLGAIRWSTNELSNTKVTMQTRTGNTIDPSGVVWYKVNNNAQGVTDGSGTGGRLSLGTNGKGDDYQIMVGSVIKDGATYKMWYSGHDGANWRVYYATSSDGLKWVKYDNTVPANSDTTGTNGRIPLGSTAGRGDVNNILVKSVMKDGSTYRMWYSGYDASNSIRVYSATSPDGLTWTKVDNTIPANSDTTSTNGRIALGTNGKGDDYYVFYPWVIKDGSTYKAWYSGYDGATWRIYYATSPDASTWTKYDNTIPSPSDITGTNGRIPLGTTGAGDDTSSHESSVTLDNGVYKMWYRGNAALYYATSSDGLTWTKYDNSIPAISDTIGTSGRVPVGYRGDNSSLECPAVITDTINGTSVYRMFYTGNLTGIYSALSYPDNSSWESWKPNTSITNYADVSDFNTHDSWSSVSSATYAEGDVTRKVYGFEDENEGNATLLTKMTYTAAAAYSEKTLGSTDLSSYDYITLWIRASQSGNTITLGMGESAATEQTEMVTIDATNTWQKVYWDISDIPELQRDAITKFRVTNNSAVSNTVYLDNLKGENYSEDGTGYEIPSTNKTYIQYRAIVTTTNTAYRPLLYKVDMSWADGYKVEVVDENNVRVNNYTADSQELKITITNGGGGASTASQWAETGGNVYRATGRVGIGDATPDVALKVVGALCVKADANDCAGATPGTIYANNTSVQSADLAEMYKVSDLSIEKGDIVSLDPNIVGEVQKATLDNVSNLMGVISTAPGLLMNDERSDNSRPVGLIGRLPVKVMTTGRSIEKGDVITSSNLAGIGVVREEPGMVVAKALEDTYDWSELTCPEVDNVSDIKWPEDKGQNEKHPCFRIAVDTFDAQTREVLMSKYNLLESESIYIGKVLAFVDVVWYQPEWISNDIAKVIGEYNSGALGGNGGGWRIDGDLLKTDKEVSVNSILGNKGDFSILSAGLLSIGNGKITADSGGNLGVSGDLLINGSIKSNSGNVLVSLGDSNGLNLFEIKNSVGDTVFSVDSRGEVGGTGVFKSSWLKVNANSSIVVAHNFDKTPSEINIVRSASSSGTGFTSQGLGVDFYYEYNDSNSVKVYNKTSQVMYVKLTIKR